MSTTLQESNRRHNAFHADIARKAAALTGEATQAFATFASLKPDVPAPRYVPRAKGPLSEMFAYELAWHLEITGVELGPADFPEPASFFPGPSVRLIQEVTCDVCGVSLRDMLSRARGARWTTHVRGIGMYLSKKVANRSLPDIAKRFNRGDHTTAFHAIRRIERLMATDRELADEINFITAILEERS